jgi:hypothetical protein
MMKLAGILILKNNHETRHPAHHSDAYYYDYLLYHLALFTRKHTEDSLKIIMDNYSQYHIYDDYPEDEE